MKRTIHIEKLDCGFIVTEGGKREAVQNHITVVDKMKAALDKLLERITKFETSEMVVSIEVDYNPPKEELI